LEVQSAQIQLLLLAWDKYEAIWWVNRTNATQHNILQNSLADGGADALLAGNGKPTKPIK
jgi:hypothetical protein